MRTTLNLSDDVFKVAWQMAQREHISLGEAVSHLARIGSQEQTLCKVTKSVFSSEYSVLAKQKRIVTNQHVRRLIEKEGV